MRKLIRGAVAACLALPLFLASSTSAQAAPDPLAATSGFYVDPNSSPAAWAAANPGDGRASAIRSSIANTPMARWFGSWSGDISSAVGSYVGAAASANKLPLLVAYNMYGRDACGGQSSGGAASPSAYASWIAAFANGIGSRPAVVILEPDSLGDYSCMSQDKINERQNMLINALSQFQSTAPNAWIYLDGGNPGWIPASTMADHLNAAGLSRAHGFSLNVSNYFPTSQNSSYAGSVNQLLSQRYGYSKPFVVDTSRNGNGSKDRAPRRGGSCRSSPTGWATATDVLMPAASAPDHPAPASRPAATCRRAACPYRPGLDGLRTGWPSTEVASRQEPSPYGRRNRSDTPPTPRKASEPPAVWRDSSAPPAC